MDQGELKELLKEITIKTFDAIKVVEKRNIVLELRIMQLEEEIKELKK
jgi:hypothetical protein